MLIGIFECILALLCGERYPKLVGLSYGLWLGEMVGHGACAEPALTPVFPPAPATSSTWRTCRTGALPVLPPAPAEPAPESGNIHRDLH